MLVTQKLGDDISDMVDDGFNILNTYKYSVVINDHHIVILYVTMPIIYIDDVIIYSCT